MDFETGQLCGPLSCGKILPSVCLPAPVAGLMSAKAWTMFSQPRGARSSERSLPSSTCLFTAWPCTAPCCFLPLQDQSLLPPKLCVCICNPAGVVLFQRNNHSSGGCCSISQGANFLKTCLAKRHLSSSLLYQQAKRRWWCVANKLKKC